MTNFSKAPLFVRSLTDTERLFLLNGLRSPVAFTLRRCQILLSSADRHTPRQIARHLGCTDQTVRNVIKAFETEGVASLQAKSRAAKSVKPLFDEAKGEQLRAILHQSPRSFGKPRSLWTLELAAEVCFSQGITDEQVSDETIRRSLGRMKISWKRAKDWINSPDPAYQRKKTRATD